MRGIAYSAQVALRARVAAFLASEMGGDTNIAAALLLPVFSLYTRDSAAADLLRRYYMHVSLRCDFLIWQTIERKLGCVDREVRSAVKDGLRDVFDDPGGANGAAWASFKARFDGELHNVHVSSRKLTYLGGVVPVRNSENFNPKISQVRNI